MVAANAGVSLGKLGSTCVCTGTAAILLEVSGVNNIRICDIMLHASSRMLGLEHSTCNPAGHRASNAVSTCVREGMKVT